MRLNDVALPAGYESQPIGGFHDRPDRHAYELYYVYGPPSQTDSRGPVEALDEDRSYWRVRWLGADSADDEARDASQDELLTFAQARERWQGKLTFKRFSSIERMRNALPAVVAAGSRREEPQSRRA